MKTTRDIANPKPFPCSDVLAEPPAGHHPTCSLALVTKPGDVFEDDQQVLAQLWEAHDNTRFVWVAVPQYFIARKPRTDPPAERL